MSREKIFARIASLSDLQVRRLMSDIFVRVDQDRESQQINEDLIAERDYWKKLYEEKLPLNSSYTDIFLQTIKTYSDFFETLDQKRSEDDKMLPELKQKLEITGDFAKYMTGFINNPSGNLGQIACVVYLFCDYLCCLSIKDKSEQEQYLQSFPVLEDLNCLGGTEERLESILKRIDVNYKFAPFLDAHEISIRKSLDSLEYYVQEGNQVHIPDYLKYNLGIIDHPRNEVIKFDIPFAKAFEIQADYAKKLKEALIKELDYIFDSRAKNIDEILRNLVSVFPENYPTKDAYLFSIEGEAFSSTIISTLKEYIVDEDVIVIPVNDSEEELYTFNQETLDRAAINIDSIKVIEE